MINEQTLFILGAGASIPYGFPSSKKLRADIIKNSISLVDFYSEVNNGKWEREKLETEILEFTARFSESGIISIDRFLRRNPKYSDIGKMAIVYNIQHSEKNSKFDEKMGIEYIEQNWYSILYNRMIDGLSSPKDILKFGENKVCFLTFNYDRSLEYYLKRCLNNSFEGSTVELCREQLNKIPIYHVYGSLMGGPKNYGYDSNGKYYKFLESSKGIAIIDDDFVDQDAIKLIKNAKRIFILGFGFDKENVRRIGLDRTITTKQRIYMTAIGFNERNRKIIQTEFEGCQKRNSKTSACREVIVRQIGCGELLDSYL